MSSPQIPQKIIVYTPFKVASCTIVHTLRRLGYIVRQQEQGQLDKYYRNKYLVIKGHVVDTASTIFSGNKKYDLWITIVRPPSHMYLSGYFQDIENPRYPYYFGDQEKIQNSNSQILMRHFLSFEWNKFRQYSFDYNFSEIKKHTGIDIWNEPFNIDQGYQIYESNTDLCKKVCVIRFDQINNLRIINKMFNELRIPFIGLQNDNLTSKKWYGKIYAVMRGLLPKEYYDKYREDDQKIIDKFYKTNS